MLLTADIGNTNITLGLFDENKYINEFRLASDRDLSGEEYEILLKSLFKDYLIEGCVIASVVEELNIKFKRAVDNVFRINSVFVDCDVSLGITIKTDNPREVLFFVVSDGYYPYLSAIKPYLSLSTLIPYFSC